MKLGSLIVGHMDTMHIIAMFCFLQTQVLLGTITEIIENTEYFLSQVDTIYGNPFFADNVIPLGDCCCFCDRALVFIAINAAIVLMLGHAYMIK